MPKRIIVDPLFDNKYIPDPNSGCWHWIGAIDTKGYGQIRKKDKLWQAHRYSYYIHNDNYNKELWVLHSCDTPCCVNPNHLRQGTIQDNMSDLVKRNRGKVPRPSLKGELHHSSKLTDKIVKEIRYKYNTMMIRIIDLSKIYGVSTFTIGAVVRRKTWKHV